MNALGNMLVCGLIQVTLVTPATSSARMAAQKTQQLNNMKQIMLALHNYYDAHGHFPPAVAIDKESGIRRSWRVEILPFIEGGALYQEYRKNEPWDSEANKNVLTQMPSVFRHPSEPGDSTTTSVFAVGLGDGSLRFISKTIDQTVLKKLFTRSGGEVVGQF